jgi:hypothetical protein
MNEIVLHRDGGLVCELEKIERHLIECRKALGLIAVMAASGLLDRRPLAPLTARRAGRPDRPAARQ